MNTMRSMLTLLGLSLCAVGPVHAQIVRLAYEGNAGLLNPYTPTDTHYGRKVVAGDVDGDGIDDLIVARSGATRMRVLRGVNWTVGQAGPVIKFIASTVTTPSFNGPVAVGDFDGDGRDEVALGSPSYSESGLPSQGSVAIMNRAANGVWSVQETIRIGSFGYIGTPGAGDRLGHALASGDFDEDGYDDLAIGANGRSVFFADEAGIVLIAYGSASGLGPAGSELFSRLSDGQGISPEAEDGYGGTLAVADFSGDGPEDLAIGIPGARCPNDGRGGAVVVLRGSGNGLTDVQSRSYVAGVGGVPGECTNLRRFGSAVATGYFNLDARPDLAIAAGGDSSARGSVTVLPSTITGPGAGNSHLFRGIDMPVPVAAGGVFGHFLTTGPVRGTGLVLDSLVVGVPFDSVDGLDQAGSVWVLHPTVDGLTLARAERLTLRAPLAIAPAGANDQFGSTLAVGDFNDDNARDLAIGTYLNDNQAPDAGAVQVIYQSEFIFRDGFED